MKHFLGLGYSMSMENTAGGNKTRSVMDKALLSIAKWPIYFVYIFVPSSSPFVNNKILPFGESQNFGENISIERNLS